MTYDAGHERQALAKLFYQLADGSESMNRSKALVEFTTRAVRLAAVLDEPLKSVLEVVEADARDFGWELDNAERQDS